MKPLRELESLRVLDAGAACSWLVAAISDPNGTVRSLIPRGFTAYVRIANGPTADQRNATEQSDPYLTEGTLSAPVLERLIANVEPFTPDSMCLFAFWDGWAWLHGPPQHQSLPPGDVGRWETFPSGVLFRLQHREYRVYEGSLSHVRRLSKSAETYAHSPNLWWPTDRSWIAVTDIDLRSTFIGGSLDLAKALEKDSALRVQKVGLNDRF